MTGQNGAESVAREVAALALASGSTVMRAAKKAGVTRNTVHRWLREQPFRDRVSLASRIWADDVHDRIASLAHEACDAIALALRKPGERIAAAKLVLDRLAPATQKHEVKAAEMSDEELTASLEKLGWRKEQEQ